MRTDEDRKQGLPVIDVGAPVETSNRGTEGYSVFIQDQTSPVLTVPFLQERSTVTLAADVSTGDRIVNLTPGHGSIVGEILELAITGGQIFMQSKILAVNIDAITIDQPANRPYTTLDSTVVRSTGQLLVDGSVTPQVFSILPLTGQVGDMVRIIINILGTGPMDFETFGSDAALANGCVIRVKKPDGTFKNLFNFKTNGEFTNQGFDYAFQQNTANNTRSFSSRVTWGGQSKHGVVIRLDGELGEELQIVIQDNLTGGENTSFTLQAQGHETQG